MNYLVIKIFAEIIGYTVFFQFLAASTGSASLFIELINKLFISEVFILL